LIREGRRAALLLAELVALLVVLVAAPCANATTLTARVDKDQVVLGGAVVLEITSVAPGDARPLDRLSLDELMADFEVLDASVGTRTVAGQTTQTLTASLYPRRPGRARIPAWRVPNARSAPIDITVRESGPDRGRVLIRLGVEPDRPHVRAGAVLYLDIYDPNDLAWSAPEPVPGAGVHLRALAESQRTETLDGERYSVLRYNWAATALRDGAIEVAFEVLRARKFGLPLRYSVPKFSFTVQPVPAWLPVHVPIGAPEIRMGAPPEVWPVGRPVNWSFRITGSGLSANGLKQLLAATLDQGSAVQWYAPQVEAVDEARPRTPRQSFQVTIPVQALEHGAAQLPQVRVPYFDVEHGRLDVIEIPGARIAAVSAARVNAWRAFVVVLVLPLAAGVLYHAVGAWRRARRRREMFARITRAQSAGEIKSALLELSGRRDTPRSLTLRRWRESAGVSADSEPAAWAAQLERACYAGSADDVATLKARAPRVLRALPRRQAQRQLDAVRRFGSDV
jgi:hypothetical protein